LEVAYPPEALDWLVHWLLKVTKDFQNLPPEFGHNASVHFCDVGAGDGKLTRSFLPILQEAARKSDHCSNQFTVNAVAVEPVSAMRNKLKQSKIIQGNVSVLDGHALNLPLPDQSVHSVIAAQSFNWFANVPALFEITRVLRPKGFLGILFSCPDHTKADYISEIEHNLINPLWQKHKGCVVSETALNRKGRERWKEVFDTFLGSYFGPLHSHNSTHHQLASKAEILNMYRKHPAVAVLDEKEKNGVLTQIEDILLGINNSDWVDSGTFKVPFDTRAYWAMKLW